jgi:hypothetical protein
MRVRRYVVYKFHTAPPPWDFVEGAGRFFTRRGAERKRNSLGPRAHEFLSVAFSEGKVPMFYYEVHRLPRKRLHRQIRRWVYGHYRRLQYKRRSRAW